MANQTARINRGRGHSYKLDGKKADGVTTVLSNGVPKPALVGWAARTAAEFAVDHVEQWRAFSRQQAIATIKEAPWADRDEAGNRGTEVHRLAEQIAAGEEVEVPEPLIGHVDAYLAFLADFDPEVVMLETVVLNRKYGYMGTLDSVMRFVMPELGLAQVELKTNRSGPFRETRLQNAAYRYSEAYLDEDGNEHPMPVLDSCCVLWLRADGYDLKPIDAGPETFRTFLYAQQIAHFTQADDDGIGDSIVAPTKKRGAA